jgi:hypothetical protein
MADILDQIGDISPARIRMPPYPAKVEDVVEIERRESRLFEVAGG